MKSTIILLLFIGYSITCLSQEKVDNAVLLDYYQNQRFADASDYLKKIYTEPVTDVKALSQLAYTSQMAGRLPDAEGYYQRIYDADSTNKGVLYSLGSINLRRGNITKAETYYKRIIASDTSNFIVYKQLAQISHDKNNIDDNIYYLQKANLLNPAEPDVASDLSDIYVNLKLTTPAEKVLNLAIAADPENIVLLNSLMKLEYAQKKWPETINTCLKLIDNGNQSGQVLIKLGVAYYNTKNYECSVAAFADMDEIARNETSYYYTALAYKALKDQPMGIFNLNKAITEGVSPNVGAYYGEIADSNEKLFKYKKAVLAYQKSLQFNESAMVYYSLANVYDTNLNDKKAAVKYYKLYLATKPSVSQKPFIDYSKSRIAILRSR
ncbi:tetratricopeptide repeat protein [Inquilinus sp. KBS0705]|nr:tetratricopeptide repeat protein [Inquilinus sp. KBS0705]